MNILFETAALATCVFTGLYAGSMLTEAGILVPYWKKMDPGDFLRLHKTMAPMLFRFYAPLTVLGTISPSVVVLIGLLLGVSVSGFWWFAVATSLLVLSVYFLYFKAANESFENGTDPKQAAKTLAECLPAGVVGTMFSS